ncbi:hypothetical protein MMC11_007697 [Xylographa trunciseda]|nr:hypothetical protein [Xylographa trunciseda]
MSGLEVALPLLFGAITTGTSVVSAYSELRKGKTERSTPWLQGYEKFTQVEGAVVFALGADGSISGESKAGGRGVFISTPITKSRQQRLL